MYQTTRRHFLEDGNADSHHRFPTIQLLSYTVTSQKTWTFNLKISLPLQLAHPKPTALTTASQSLRPFGNRICVLRGTLLYLTIRFILHSDRFLWRQAVRRSQLFQKTQKTVSRGPAVYFNAVQWTSGFYSTFLHHCVVCPVVSPQPLPKRVPHTAQFTASSFNWQYPLFSLMSSSSCLRLPPLLVPSVFPSLRCFCRQFVRKTWPIQLAFLRFTALGFVPVPLLYVTLLHFSHDRSNWFVPFFSSTAFQKFPPISDLLSEMSRFQHHTKPCSICCTLPVYFLNLSPSCWIKCSDAYRQLADIRHI
jgi:hypothetical protein